jgi:hypothetical protein
MQPPRTRLIDRLAERRALRFWQGAAGAAGAADLDTLKGWRGRARRLRRELDRVLAVAEGRLALPLIGSDAMNRPLGADWVWRPDYWREPVSPRGMAGVARRTDIGDGIVLFHDCPMGAAAVRQERNRRPGDLAPFGMMLEVFEFQGGFLSLAIDLPASAAENLSRRHLVRVEFDIDVERPLAFFARLNVKHGPNTEQIQAHVRLDRGEPHAEFDLALVKINESRIEKVWLDLIFENPGMNGISLRDLRMSRRPRAEL